MTLEEVIAALRAEPTQSVPFTGRVLGGLQRGASYQAAKTNSLGVEVFWSGGKLRTASIDIARRLGVEDAVAPAKDDEQRAKPTPVAAAPVAPLAAPKSALAARKPPAPKAVAARKAPAPHKPTKAKPVAAE
jgi:hypothetical protein